MFLTNEHHRDIFPLTTFQRNTGSNHNRILVTCMVRGGLRYTRVWLGMDNFFIASLTQNFSYFYNQLFNKCYYILKKKMKFGPSFSAKLKKNDIVINDHTSCAKDIYLNINSLPQDLWYSYKSVLNKSRILLKKIEISSNLSCIS